MVKKKEERIFNKPMKVLLLVVVALGLGILLMFIFGKSDKVGGVGIMEEEGGSLHKNLSDVAVVFGIEVDGKFKAYSEEKVIEEGEIVDEDFGVKVSRSEDGIVKIVRLNDEFEIVNEREFWFAWFASHPDTELYG